VPSCPLPPFCIRFRAHHPIAVHGLAPRGRLSSSPRPAIPKVLFTCVDTLVYAVFLLLIALFDRQKIESRRQCMSASSSSLRSVRARCSSPTVRVRYAPAPPCCVATLGALVKVPRSGPGYLLSLHGGWSALGVEIKGRLCMFSYAFLVVSFHRQAGRTETIAVNAKTKSQLIAPCLWWRQWRQTLANPGWHLAPS
jgi:hypothetical protein